MLEIWVVLSNLIVAAATFFTGVIAWLIYKGWRNQKGSEVVANEAKNVAIDIEEIESVFRELVYSKEKFKNDEYFNEVMIRMVNLLKSNFNRLSFIQRFIADPEKLKLINEKKESLDLIESKFYFIDDYEDIECYSDFLNNTLNEVENESLLDSLKILADVCREIALYRFQLNKPKN